MDRKSFQELVFKAVKNRKRSGYVDCQQVRSIDRNPFFSKLKLLILRQWWQLYDESYTAAYVYANEQLDPCFYVSVRYSLLFSSEIILKQLYASGSVNIVE